MSFGPDNNQLCVHGRRSLCEVIRVEKPFCRSAIETVKVPDAHVECSGPW